MGDCYTTLGCARLWAGRRWSISQVPPPPELARLTQGPAMWANLMLLRRVRLGRQQSRMRVGAQGAGDSREQTGSALSW